MSFRAGYAQATDDAYDVPDALRLAVLSYAGRWFAPLMGIEQAAKGTPWSQWTSTAY